MHTSLVLFTMRDIWDFCVLSFWSWISFIVFLGVQLDWHHIFYGYLVKLVQNLL